MSINLDGLMASFPVMLKGMIGIFIVTGVIVLTISILSMLEAKRANKADEAE